MFEKAIAESLEADFKKALQDKHNEIQSAPKNGKSLYKYSRDETLFTHTMTGILWR